MTVRTNEPNAGIEDAYTSGASGAGADMTVEMATDATADGPAASGPGDGDDADSSTPITDGTTPTSSPKRKRNRRGGGSQNPKTAVRRMPTSAVATFMIRRRSDDRAHPRMAPESGDYM